MTKIRKKENILRERDENPLLNFNSQNAGDDFHIHLNYLYITK